MSEHKQYLSEDSFHLSSELESDATIERLRSLTKQLRHEVDFATKQYSPEVDLVMFSTEQAVVNNLVNQLLEKYYYLENNYHLSGLGLEKTELVATELQRQSDYLNDFYSRLISPLKCHLLTLQKSDTELT